MQVILRNYSGNPNPIEIPEDCEYIAGIILSGDMIMHEPFFKDTGECRMMDFYDGEFYIKKSQFSQMHELTDSYQIPKYLINGIHCNKEQHAL